MNQESFEPNTRKGTVRFESGEMPQKPRTEGTRTELTASPETERLQRMVDETDAAFFGMLKSRGVESLEQLIDTIDTIETLRYGKELSRKMVGVEGALNVNAVTRRTYEGTPPRTAYVKAESGESSYGANEAGSAWVKKTRRWNEDSRQFSTIETDLDDADRQILGFMVKNQQKFREDIAKYYGVAADELPIKPNEFSYRIGVESGTGHLREYATSRISELFNLHAVPLTAVRTETDRSELASVQEAVKATDPENPPRPMDKELFDELVAQGPQHPGAKSLMNIACLDYLIRNLDRHHENILYDPESKAFQGIDHGLAFGLSATEQLTDTDNQPVGWDRIRSVPLEIIQKYPDWTLDEETRGSLKKVFDAIVDYTKRRETRTGAEAPSPTTEGFEAKFLTKLFRTVYKNEQIASKEINAFALRLKTLIEKGRPPEDLALLEIADELWPTQAEE